MRFQALSHDDCENFVCDVEQTDSSVVFAVTLVSFLVDRTDDAVSSISQQNLVDFSSNT